MSWKSSATTWSGSGAPVGVHQRGQHGAFTLGVVHLTAGALLQLRDFVHQLRAPRQQLKQLEVDAVDALAELGEP
jgi:hypothetical protein